MVIDFNDKLHFAESLNAQVDILGCLQGVVEIADDNPGIEFVFLLWHEEGIVHFRIGVMPIIGSAAGVFSFENALPNLWFANVGILERIRNRRG